jgi:hypothetical protein
VSQDNKVHKSTFNPLHRKSKYQLTKDYRPESIYLSEVEDSPQICFSTDQNVTECNKWINSGIRRFRTSNLNEA